MPKDIKSDSPLPDAHLYEPECEMHVICCLSLHFPNAERFLRGQV